MSKASKTPGKWAKNMGLLGIGLCALCCTLPILGIIGGTGILASVGIFAQKIALALLIISAGLFMLWLYKKKPTPHSCSVDCSCKTVGNDSKYVDINTK